MPPDRHSVGGNTFMDTGHGNPTGLVLPLQRRSGGGADDGSSPLSGQFPESEAVRRGGQSDFVVNMPAPAGLNTGSAIGLTMGSVAGAFNLNLRPLGHGVHRPRPHPVLAAYHHDGQHRCNDRAGRDRFRCRSSAQWARRTQFVDAKLHPGCEAACDQRGTIMLTVNVTKNEPDFVNTGSRADPTILKKEAKTTTAGARWRHGGHRRYLHAQLGPQLPTRFRSSRTSRWWDGSSAIARRTTTVPSSWSFSHHA